MCGCVCVLSVYLLGFAVIVFSGAGSGRGHAPPALSVMSWTAAVAGWRQAATATTIHQQDSAMQVPPQLWLHIPAVTLSHQHTHTHTHVDTHTHMPTCYGDLAHRGPRAPGVVFLISGAPSVLRVKAGRAAGTGSGSGTVISSRWDSFLFNSGFLCSVSPTCGIN